MSNINFPATTTSLLVNTWTTSKIVYLPPVSTIGAGKFFYIKDICGNAAKSTIFISTVGLDRIDQSFPPSTINAFLSTNFGSVLLAPDGGTNWMVLQNYTLNAVKRNTKEVPKSIQTLSLWLDATDPTNGGAIPANNAVVSTWFDKSGLGNNLTGFNNPTFRTSPFRMSNFSGAYFYATSPNSYLMTLFIVYYDNNDQGCAPVYTENPNQDATGLFPNCGGTTYFQVNGGSWATQGSSIPKNTQNLLMIQYTSSNAYVWLNGTLNFTVSTNAFTRTGISFGRRGNEILHGFYYEIVHYSSVITTTEQQRIEGYLAWKWGLQGNLPSNHPHKNASP